MKVDKDTLVVYQGGGYSGCFWEWNAFYLDKEGEFHILAATGNMGCKTLEKFESNFEADYERHAEFFTKDTVEKFAETFHAGIVKGALNWLDDNTDWIIPQVKCVCCESHFSLYEVDLNEYDDSEFICWECERDRNTQWTLTADDGTTIEIQQSDLFNEEKYKDLMEKIYPHYRGEDLLPKENYSLPMDFATRYNNCMEDGEERKVDFEWGEFKIVSIRYDECY